MAPSMSSCPRPLKAVLIALAANSISALKVGQPQPNQTITTVANQGNATMHFVCKAPGSTQESSQEWYDEERARIKKDCDGMRKKLDEEYQNRLNGKVSQAEGKAGDAQKRVQDAQNDLDREKSHVDREKGHEAQAEKDCDGAKKGLNADASKIGEYKKNIKDLEGEIEEKKKCVEDLRRAELELAKTERDLCEAKRKEMEKELELAKQKNGVTKEEKHVAKEQHHISDAENDLKKANAEAAAAEASLAKARAARDMARQHASDKGLSSDERPTAPKQHTPVQPVTAHHDAEDGGAFHKVVKKEGGTAGWGNNVTSVTAVKH